MAKKSSKIKPLKKGKPATAKADANAGVKANAPDFEMSGVVAEFHDIKPSERLSGQRIKINCVNKDLTPGDDASRKKRTKYGKLKLSFFPNDDSSESIELEGRIEITDTVPTQAGETGERAINFYLRTPVGIAVITKILKLKADALSNDPKTITVEFAGVFNQKEMFPE